MSTFYYDVFFEKLNTNSSIKNHKFHYFEAYLNEQEDFTIIKAEVHIHIYFKLNEI